MAIEDRSLERAAARFKEHLNGVLAHTVTRAPLVLVPLSTGKNRGAVFLGFRQGGHALPARIATRYGEMGLYLGQLLEAERPTRVHRYRLYTAQYAYFLHPTPDPNTEPVLRWEYEKRWPNPEARWCRHHLQGANALDLGDARVPMDSMHLPTGYVPIEEVLRFLITDLDVPPLADDWHAVLERSYRRFREEFAAP